MPIYVKYGDIKGDVTAEGQRVEIDFRMTDKGKLEVYAKYILENAMVSGYSVSSGGDRPSESISINFTKIEYNVNEMDAANASASTPKVIYDIAKDKVG